MDHIERAGDFSVRDPNQPIADVGSDRPSAASLADGQVFVGPVQPDDLPAMFRWINDRDLVVLSGPYHPVSAREHEEWFREIQGRADVVLLAIRLATTGELIGTAQLHSIHAVHRQAELQIRIADPSHRSKGYGGSALRLLLRVAFDDLNLNRVMLHVFADNAAAIRAYEKVGFIQEGVLREGAFIAGAFVDTVVMGILRHEYEAGRRT